jgi:hypothetical protein
VLGKVAVTALRWISPIGFCTVPGVQVLIFVQRTAKSAPVVPILLIRINYVGLVVTSEVEAKKVFFSESEWDIEFSSYTSRLLVALIWAYKAHGVESRYVCERIRRFSIDKRPKDALLDERTAECLAVVICCTPCQPDALVQQTLRNTTEINFQPRTKKSLELLQSWFECRVEKFDLVRRR